MKNKNTLTKENIKTSFQKCMETSLMLSIEKSNGDLSKIKIIKNNIF